MASCTTIVEKGYFNPLPFTPKGDIQYCFNGSPPIPNDRMKPFIYGGRDLSMPGPNDTELANAYEEFGIVWEGNKCPGGCNGYCKKGPYVAFGGHCLTPPTPGTKEYNDVILGVGVTNWLFPLWKEKHSNKLK